jgi:hypothetical protein
LEFAVRTKVLTFFAALTLASLIVTNALAGPPMTGDSASKGMGDWMAPLNPMTWSMPKMPWSSEPARIKKKSPSTMSKVTQSTKEGWSKTTHALNPARLFNSDSPPKPAPKPMSNQKETGFFGSLFGPKEEPKEIRTVNDFLNQPQLR